MTDYSVSPAGEKYAIPQQDEYAGEFQRVESLVKAARDEGKEIVVVMGVGFVGAVMAAIIADTVDKETGKLTHTAEVSDDEIESMSAFKDFINSLDMEDFEEKGREKD